MNTSQTLEKLKTADQDYEWYPTTLPMIHAVGKRLGANTNSILDIGAGDGRVLQELCKNLNEHAELYAIEKSSIHLDSLPSSIIPVGTNFHQQDLTALQADVIFCNPPYSEYIEWASRIIATGYAKYAYLVIPSRWKESPVIKQAIESRGATSRVIYSGDFLEADRQARAKVDVLEIGFPKKSEYAGGKPIDPFDIWFDQNIDIFDESEDIKDPESPNNYLSKIKNADTLSRLVELYNMERGSMEDNYRTIFQLDKELLKELGVDKENVRDGIKKKINDLKGKYWAALFNRMTMLTDRLTSKTRQKFLDMINARSVVEFTYDNAHAVALWSVKNANQYYDSQLIDVFQRLSAPQNIENYVSNKKTWEQEGWRFRDSKHSHYKLDYRIVVENCRALYAGNDIYTWQYPGNLHQDAHNLVGDVCAVMHNLGYAAVGLPSLQREWESGKWQDFKDCRDEVIFQVKAFKKGTLHFRFRQDCIASLNVEAGRLLKWLKSPEQAESEVGKGSAKHYKSNFKLIGSSDFLLENKKN